MQEPKETQPSSDPAFNRSAQGEAVFDAYEATGCGFEQPTPVLLSAEISQSRCRPKIKQYSAAYSASQLTWQIWLNGATNCQVGLSVCSLCASCVSHMHQNSLLTLLILKIVQFLINYKTFPNQKLWLHKKAVRFSLRCCGYQACRHVFKCSLSRDTCPLACICMSASVHDSTIYSDLQD